MTLQNIDIIAQNAAIDVPAGLKDRSAWIISDGIAGHLAITRGIAETLELNAEIIQISPRWPWRLLAPNGPADRRELNPMLGRSWPELILGAGRQTVPFVRALKRASHGKIFTVLFQAPRTVRQSADVIWAPVHDRLQGGNVISTLTPPHGFTAGRLARLRAEIPADITELPAPRIALLIGGPGAGYSYDREIIARLTERIKQVTAFAGGLLITPSRRTPPELLAAIDSITANVPRILWRGTGENPYPHFLAHADMFIVTADSVNMAGEACATGKPIYVFSPPGGREKFARYHEALREHGATRPLPEPTSRLESWTYQPIHSTESVAAEIVRRWYSFQSTNTSS